MSLASVKKVNQHDSPNDSLESDSLPSESQPKPVLFLRADKRKRHQKLINSMTKLYDGPNHKDAYETSKAYKHSRLLRVFPMVHSKVELSGVLTLK